MVKTDQDVKDRIVEFLVERHRANDASDHEMVRMYDFALTQLLWMLED